MGMFLHVNCLSQFSYDSVTILCDMAVLMPVVSVNFDKMMKLMMLANFLCHVQLAPPLGATPLKYHQDV